MEQVNSLVLIQNRQRNIVRFSAHIMSIEDYFRKLQYLLLKYEGSVGWDHRLVRSFLFSSSSAYPVEAIM